MAFDAAHYPVAQTPAGQTVTGLIDAAPAPCPRWTAENPDRALALLFVAPQDCEAVDVLTAL